jgi:hypothetical protein
METFAELLYHNLLLEVPRIHFIKEVSSIGDVRNITVIYEKEYTDVFIKVLDEFTNMIKEEGMEEKIREEPGMRTTYVVGNPVDRVDGRKFIIAVIQNDNLH